MGEVFRTGLAPVCIPDPRGVNVLSKTHVLPPSSRTYVRVGEPPAGVRCLSLGWKFWILCFAFLGCDGVLLVFLVMSQKGMRSKTVPTFGVRLHHVQGPLVSLPCCGQIGYSWSSRLWGVIMGAVGERNQGVWGGVDPGK